ncbi:hypothetical protein KW429_11055 [Vibrio fluvialis]|nr:hypothetical protein [Vibrio fluvialis]MBY7902390.1 hypothetical protein [Vibrio fluvialis]
MDAIDPIEKFFELLSHPSITHWLSLFLGDWIKGVWDSDASMNNPITALMVALSMLNIVAMAAMLIILSFVGGRSLLSGLFTANMATGLSKYLPIRVLIGFALLMPTDGGVVALSAYNLTISSVQMTMARLILAGGSMADVIWQVTAKAMFDFNIGGAPNLRNTVMRSNSLAEGFVCAELYNKTIGSEKGERKYYFQINDSDLEGVDSVGAITPPSLNDEEQLLVVLLGGKSGQCGSITMRLLPEGKAPKIGNAIYPSINTYTPKIKSAMRLQVVKSYLGLLPQYEAFASVFYESFASHTAVNSLRALAEDQPNGIRFDPTEINAGQVPATSRSDSLNVRTNGHADGLIYLAQRMAYTQQYLVTQVTQSIPLQLGDSSDITVNLKALAPKFFDNFMSGYISAGLFWGVSQDFTSLSYGAERYMNEISILLPEWDSGLLCDSSWISNLFGNDDSDCESLQLMKNVYPMLVTFSGVKGANGQFTKNVEIGEGGSYQVDSSAWKNFFSVASSGGAQQTIESASWVTLSVVKLFDNLWDGLHWVRGFQSDGTFLTSGNNEETLGLLSGTDALVFNMSGQNSPYIMLNQLGEGMRDVAFDLRMLAIVARGLSTGTYEQAKNSIRSLWDTSKLLGILATGFAWLSTIAFETIKDALALIQQLISGLSLSSLILIYGVPAIPTVGWIMICLGLFFVFVSAMAAAPFAAPLVILPKGDGLLSPDTERLLSMIYGVFVRQSLTVIGFVASMYCGYVGLSLINLLWFATFLPRLAGMSPLDAISAVIFIFVGYAVTVFFACLYSFRWTHLLVDAVGVWFSSYLAGGAFANHDGDQQAATQAIRALGSQMNDIAQRPRKPSPYNNDKPDEKNDPEQPKMNA